MTATAAPIVETETRRPDLDDGDHERFAHYVPKAQLNEALVMGTPVIALCGKTWIPHRDPDRYPICPTCKEIKEARRGG